MFAVIFEVQPKAERWNDYLDLAGLLRPELEKIDGFIDNQRFISRQRPGRVLSLSTWRDEKALIRWRTLPVHHRAQQQGRSGIFADYQLRVGEIIADTDLVRGHSLPQQRFDETETGAAKLVTISELAAVDPARPDNGALAADLGLPAAEAGSILGARSFRRHQRSGETAAARFLAGPDRRPKLAAESGGGRRRRAPPGGADHSRLRHARAARGAAISPRGRGRLLSPRHFGSDRSKSVRSVTGRPCR